MTGLLKNVVVKMSLMVCKETGGTAWAYCLSSAKERFKDILLFQISLRAT